MFECLPLIQTGRRERIPFLLFGRAFWERLIDGHSQVEEALIAESDLGLFRYVETAEEAMAVMGGSGGAAGPPTGAGSAAGD